MINSTDFDRFLSEDAVHPTHVVVSPKIYNGFWYYKYPSNKLSSFIRWVGRKLKNKYIYWLGRPLVWMVGLKELILDPNIEVIYPE